MQDQNNKFRTVTREIHGQLVNVTICPPARAYGSGPKKAWTAKSKNYLLNGMLPK